MPAFATSAATGPSRSAAPKAPSTSPSIEMSACTAAAVPPSRSMPATTASAALSVVAVGEAHRPASGRGPYRDSGSDTAAPARYQHDASMHRWTLPSSCRRAAARGPSYLVKKGSPQRHFSFQIMGKRPRAMLTTRTAGRGSRHGRLGTRPRRRRRGREIDCGPAVGIASHTPRLARNSERASTSSGTIERAPSVPLRGSSGSTQTPLRAPSRWARQGRSWARTCGLEAGGEQAAETLRLPLRLLGQHLLEAGACRARALANSVPPVARPARSANGVSALAAITRASSARIP